ncbi:MAG: hypothetical protein WBM90_08185 [Acidimicrobiia bacterium]
MVGKGRGALLGVRANEPVLSLLAPVGLAASVPTSLLIDFDDDLGFPRRRTLEEIALEGPNIVELSPGRSGVAMMARGGLAVPEASRMIEELARVWPAVVIRTKAGEWPGPTVPVRALYPGWLAPRDETPAVWQPVSGHNKPPGPGPVLPRVPASLVRRVLGGSLPSRTRWVKAWSRIWDLPWA